jgi:multidrug resistance protein, MATE family
LLAVFINDASALALAVDPLRLAGLAMAVEGVSFALMNCLLGAGDSRRVMIVSISLQWGLFLPAAYVAGPLLGAGLLGIWLINLAYRVLLALSFYVAWRGGRWSKISL